MRGVFALSFMACWSGRSEPTTPIATGVEPNTSDLTGPYWCSFDDQEPDHPRQPCRIIKRGDTLELAMLAGGERIHGTITLDADGFRFAGALHSTFDNYTTDLNGRFEPSGRGGFRGTFREDALVLYLVPAPQNAFGGAQYGGDEYGYGYGSRYGGSRYGSVIRRRILIDNRGRPGR
jgi:hypothetical protein